MINVEHTYCTWFRQCVLKGQVSQSLDSNYMPDKLELTVRVTILIL